MIPLMLILAVAPPRPNPAKPSANASSSAAQSDAELRQQIETYLHYFESPVTDAQWQSLGPAAEPILAQIATSDGLPTRRARAVAGLAALRGPSTAALLSSFSLDEKKPITVRLTAVEGLSRMTADDALVATLRPMVMAKDDRVAAAAAEAIARRAPDAGCSLVRSRGSGSLRFDAALKTCASR
jgi:hypothetical protein